MLKLCCARKVGRLAGAVGRGLFAGFVGTLAITASQTAEMKLTGREASSTPADAAGKVLGVQPADEAGKARFGQIVHFGYGTGWGAFRGLLSCLGIRGHAANLLHALAVQVTAMVMLPALQVAPPVTQWSAKQILTEMFHHLVYAYGTGAAYGQLEGEEDD